MQPNTNGTSVDIFIHNFQSGGWFRLRSSDYITCLWMESSEVYACGTGGIFAFGKGAQQSGRIEVQVGGMERKGPIASTWDKYLRDLYFRLGIKGAFTYSFSVAADGIIHAPVMNGTIDGSEHLDSIVGSGVKWDNDAAWTSPRNTWIRMTTASQVNDRRVGRSFVICIDFTGPICISAIHAAFSGDARIR